MFAIGCETQNPVCSENYCVMGEIFPRSEIGERAFEELPASVDEETVIGLLAGMSQESAAIADTSRFVSAIPSGGEIAANGTITIIFDNRPTDVTVSHGSVRVAGKVATIVGPFTPGRLALTITWANGTQALNYTVAGPDTDPITIIGGTVRNGDSVDAEFINRAAKIEVTFSEWVRGHIALQTFGGDDVGWLGSVEGNKGVLELARGKEIGNGTLYVIVCVVRDAAGNRATIKTLFHTKGVKRSPVEAPVVPEEPEVSFKDDILPIFRERCQKCHRQRARKDPEVGLDLSSYKGTLKGSRNGKVIDPGWSQDSLIVFRISHGLFGQRMPLGEDPLSAEQIQLIIDWIDQGAKNN